MAKKPENLSFEESLSELEKIVAELERGEVSLDDALKQFERGIALVRSSQTKLEQAQQRCQSCCSRMNKPPCRATTPRKNKRVSRFHFAVSTTG